MLLRQLELEGCTQRPRRLVLADPLRLCLLQLRGQSASVTLVGDLRSGDGELAPRLSFRYLRNNNNKII